MEYGQVVLLDDGSQQIRQFCRVLENLAAIHRSGGGHNSDRCADTRPMNYRRWALNLAAPNSCRKFHMNFDC